MKWGAIIAAGLFFLLAVAQPARGQFVPECPNPNPLCLDNNYFVTGDYVVGGVGLRGLGVATPYSTQALATGTISVPDCVQAKAIANNAALDCTLLPNPVPPGADIVAAFLYWETVESSASVPPHPGQNGFFKPLGQAGDNYTIPNPGYPITGTILGNPNAPTSWSSGGCSGSSQGAKTIVAYRADVRPYLLEDANGNLLANGSFQVMLADSGSNGGGVPLTLGASLVIIYRVLSSAVPLNSIVIYDGAFAPSNQTTLLSQTMQGFYQAAVSTPLIVKLTHIVGDGQDNKGETVMLGAAPLPALYPAHPSTTPFPGIYNGSWDNVTWTADNAPIITTALGPGAAMVATTVTPGSGNTGAGCVDWGAVIFSTTVEDTNHDGLLSIWKTNQGYTDAISDQNGLPNKVVSLLGANSGAQDIFVEIDYLTLRDPNTNAVLHSHLPKQIALDMVGDAFWQKGVHVHFDVGSNYNNPGGAPVCKLTPRASLGQAVCPDPYIIQGGTGGNEISESALFCADPGMPTPATLCQFPNVSSVGWKGGFQFVESHATVPNSNPAVPLGGFQFGRKDSYHYVLFGHALGASRSFWASFGATLQDPSFAKLISISNSTTGGGSTFLVTIQTPQPPAPNPQVIIYPGYCSLFPATLGCSDLNVNRITVSGAIGQPALNGTYSITPNSSGPDQNGVVTTTFTINTTGLPSGTQTYNYGNESRLTVEYLGPVSASGHSDFPGGADTAVSFGLWPADDPAGCQRNPSVPSQTYCDDQVGTIQAQAGTLLHELGHTLTLAHGGIFYPTQANPNGHLVSTDPNKGQQANDPPFSPRAYGLNCNSAIVSSMNYLFQIRGFPDLLQPPLMLPDGNQAHPIDYSGQTLPSLSEIALDEKMGIGGDVFSSELAPHYTRWYGPPTALQTQAGQFATFHCDGTPASPTEPAVVRVDGNTFSKPINWNNNSIVPDLTEPVAWQDVNFNGSTINSPDPPAHAFNYMQGFNDWANLDLRQIGSREHAFGFSGSGGAVSITQTGGGGAIRSISSGGGGAIGYAQPGGGGATIIHQSGGGGSTAYHLSGGGGDQNVETACSTADPPPPDLTATLGTKSVILNWDSPGGPCQVQTYNIWRSTNGGPFSLLANKVRGGNGSTAPPTTYTDTDVKNNNTYSYFVTETNVEGATSGATNTVTIFVK
jgi:hypothetical protein